MIDLDAITGFDWHSGNAWKNDSHGVFVAPGSPDLLRRRIDWVEDLRSNETVKRQGYFNPDTVERLKAMYRDEKESIQAALEAEGPST